jgi:cvfA/B/C family virulence factor
MATYKVLYWQEFPSQIVADDGEDEVSLPLAETFMDRIEAAAMSRGLAGADDYLAQFKWGEPIDRDGTADEVAQKVKAEFEARTDW